MTVLLSLYAILSYFPLHVLSLNESPSPLWPFPSSDLSSYQSSQVLDASFHFGVQSQSGMTLFLSILKPAAERYQNIISVSSIAVGSIKSCAIKVSDYSVDNIG